MAKESRFESDFAHDDMDVAAGALERCGVPIWRPGVVQHFDPTHIGLAE